MQGKLQNINEQYNVLRRLWLAIFASRVEAATDTAARPFLITSDLSVAAGFAGLDSLVNEYPTTVLNRLR